MSETKAKAIKGGEFIIRETDANDIFIPEQFDEEQKMIYDMCKDFLAKEVIPNLDRIDAMEEGLMPSLLDKAGELGMLSISVPEEYNGMAKNFVSTMVSTEALGSGHSFSVALSAHTGIGTLPILYYGNEEQKKKYIPKLASGEWKAAYCLTEPSSGSDANSGKTKAVLSDDGKHYVINGQKMWITNGGFADVMTVFAKIDDDKNLSAFIIDANSEGITLNPEEKKMGIKGSSTRQVFYNNVKVPVENLLSERGNGFKIAVNILNIGRIKLCGAVLGGSKDVVNLSIKYANERNQFGRPISKYGAIKSKLGQMAVECYSVESATYRASQNIDDAIAQLQADGMEKSKAILKGIEQFAPECAMLKVSGSEMLDYCVDEGVQIHGGMGFSAESHVERAYRDSRINRIFEGTNEINRMLTVDMILKRGLKGEIDLLGPAKAVGEELMGVPDFGSMPEGLFGKEKAIVKNFKKCVLLVAGAAAQKLATTLGKEQEVLMAIADMAIWTYHAESTLLRTEKRVNMLGEEASAQQIDMTKIYIEDAAPKIHKAGVDALHVFGEGDELKAMLMGMKRFTKTNGFNVHGARRRVAEAMIDKGEYCF